MDHLIFEPSMLTARRARFTLERRFFKGAATPSVPAATAPATVASASVVQEKQDTMRQDKRKRGLQATILAGDTGGFRPAPTVPGPLSNSGGQKLGS